MVHRQQLLQSFDRLLQPERFRDVAPNGLQVEGRPQVGTILSGVTASEELIESAIARGADAIFVHHGLVWRGQDGRITGWMKRRLALLLKHDINLFAYHLPLDAHPSLGNNAQLGKLLGFQATDRFGEQELGCLDSRPEAPGFTSAQAFKAHVEDRLGRSSLMVGERVGPIRQIAWCTGAAQSYFEAAIAVGAEAFLTGELSEQQTHYARESKVLFLACGHHATERYGAPAVAAHVAEQLGIQHEFVDIDNPA